MKQRTLLALGSACWALSLTAAAQQPAPPSAARPDTQPTTLSLDARLVNLPVIVRDKKGALVQTLTKDSFTLSVDGHPEAVRYFDIDRNLPLTVGLLVDVSGSVRNHLDEERTASVSFLDKMLSTPEPGTTDRAPDRAFLLQFARETELLQDVTPSRPKLQAAIRELGSTNPKASTTDDADDRNSRSARRGGGTTLYDSVFLAADEILKKQKGRKAIVLLTDGEDRNSKESLNHAIEAAQRADTVVYAIYFKGEPPRDQQQDNRRGGGFPGGGSRGGGFPGVGGGGYPGGGRNGGGGGQQRPQENRVDGKKILERITGETGGRVFEVSKKQDVAAIYGQIADELRSQYRLGFTPDAPILGDGYHQIDLTMPRDKSLILQTRDGYYTGR